MTRKILLVDDSATVLMMERMILATERFEIVTAANGEEAQERARQEQPDLILMDISMPDMDGLTATQQLRTIPQLQGTPIVALTANVMEGDREKTLRAGCDGYIGKPIDIEYIRLA